VIQNPKQSAANLKPFIWLPVGWLVLSTFIGKGEEKPAQFLQAGKPAQLSRVDVPERGAPLRRIAVPGQPHAQEERKATWICLHGFTVQPQREENAK
jgi:hypothetical protein